MSTRRILSLDPARLYERGDAERLAASRARETERWQRARSIGVIGTVLIHLLVLLLFRQTTIAPTATSSAAGPAAGDLRAAAGGGSGLTMVEVRLEQAQPEAEEVPTPVPEPVPEEVVIEPEQIEVAVTELELDPVEEPPSLPGTGLLGTGLQDGPATGPGTDTGTGDGGGGTGDAGASQIIPPRPRAIFIPPAGRPGSADGQEITVWVFVQESGRVDRNTVRLEPPTSDSRYNQRLIQSVAEWVFDPATREGQVVPVWYPFQIIL
ncbi:MAG: hypothetical protein GEU90_00260 [Gemmatimonas sp.]|nr:hypothetical protein [Gemmatimonas sp.]